MTVDNRPVLPGLAEIRAELIAIRERAGGIGVDVVKEKARRHHKLRAVLDELVHNGYEIRGDDTHLAVPPDDHALAVVQVVRCAVIHLVTDYRSQLILQRTLLDNGKKRMADRRADARVDIFYADSSEAAYTKLEQKAYTDLAAELTAARESPCWIDEVDAERERRLRDEFITAANKALLLSASGRRSVDQLRRVARTVLEELLPEGMDKLFELIAVTREATAEPDVRLLIAAVLDRHRREFEGPEHDPALRDELVGSDQPFEQLLIQGVPDRFAANVRPLRREFALIRRRSLERVAALLEQEEAGGWPSLPQAEGEMAVEFSDF